MGIFTARGRRRRHGRSRRLRGSCRPRQSCRRSVRRPCRQRNHRRSRRPHGEDAARRRGAVWARAGHGGRRGPNHHTEVCAAVCCPGRSPARNRRRGQTRRRQSRAGCCRGLIVIISVVITIRIAVADRAGGPAQGHTVEIGNGAGHIVGTGGHSRVIIARREGILHGLGNGTGLLFQRGIAEAVTGGKVIIAIGVLLGLHDQQDQHTVVFTGAAQPPGVGCLHGIILRG